MFLKALIAFLALPGIVIGLIPTLLILNDPWRIDGTLLGLLLIVPGLSLLLSCIRVFYVSGKGTLAPWSPPRHVVRIGPYGYTRSPMYAAVLMTIFGLALLFGSPITGMYAILMALIFHLNLLFVEEPMLARRHGEDWTGYVAEVPRWFPRFRRSRSLGA